MAFEVLRVALSRSRKWKLCKLKLWPLVSDLFRIPQAVQRGKVGEQHLSHCRSWWTRQYTALLSPFQSLLYMRQTVSSRLGNGAYI